MVGKTGRPIAGIAAVVAAAALGLAEEFGSGPTPVEGIVLLRNGEMIEGKISRVGELYYVAVPGGEIRLKNTEVELCCRDIDEGYRLKRAAIPPGDVDGHLRLAQWCLRHELLGAAGRELADALEADPTHPMIDLLERRLRAAVEPVPQRPPAEPIQEAPSPDDLDRLVRGLPPASVETFTQTIQPLLVNHCGAADCHGPQSQGGPQLLRLPSGGPPSRRVTQRNLQAVLAWVNREDPAASPLLTVPIRPHGAAGKPVLTAVQSEQYQRIVDWVWGLWRPAAAAAPESVAARQQPAVQAMATESLGAAFSPPQTPGASDLPAAADPGQPPRELPVEGPSVKRGGPLPLLGPVDPFDPEVFNRRYFGPSALPQPPSADAASAVDQPVK